MIVLSGASALSPFRLDRLNAALAATGTGSCVERVDWLYFVDIEGAADAVVRSRIADILDGR